MRDSYTLVDITHAVSDAIIQETGNPPRRGSSSGEYRVYSQVLRARDLAREEAGGFWEVTIEGKGSRGVPYDVGHVEDIFTKLAEVVRGAEQRRNVGVGILDIPLTSNIIGTARRRLFSEAYDTDQPQQLRVFN